MSYTYGIAKTHGTGIYLYTDLIPVRFQITVTCHRCESCGNTNHSLHNLVRIIVVNEKGEERAMRMGEVRQKYQDLAVLMGETTEFSWPELPIEKKVEYMDVTRCVRCTEKYLATLPMRKYGKIERYIPRRKEDLLRLPEFASLRYADSDEHAYESPDAEAYGGGNLRPEKEKGSGMGNSAIGASKKKPGSKKIKRKTKAPAFDLDALLK